jgi:hypothetical protein
MNKNEMRLHRWVGVLVLVIPSVHAETRVQLSAGIDYSSGNFGAVTATEVLVAPVAIKVSNGNWTWRASVPYVSISGPSTVTVIIDDNGGGGSNSGSGSSGSGSSGSSSDDSASSATGTSSRTVSGWGDASLSATYSFNKIADSPMYVDLTGRVRLPTGSQRNGIGTGATDYVLLVESGVDIEAGGVYANAGRRFVGDVTGVQRKDGWQASGGGWLNLGDAAVLGAFYDWRESSLVGLEDPSEVGAYLTLSLSRRWKLELNAARPLNDSGADYSAGATLVWRAFGYGVR